MTKLVRLGCDTAKIDLWNDHTEDSSLAHDNLSLVLNSPSNHPELPPYLVN
jgi:hypothetical protein